ncbi:hypothetical protein O1L44_27250 [Streptomyces noursei]|nr:hypothetical protein [Streptomyces noursei]
MADPTNGPVQAAPTPRTPHRSRPPAGPRGHGARRAGRPAAARAGGDPTGQAAVDGGLRRLAEADHLPVSGHLDMYEDVHRGLRDVLAGLDQHPGPPAPSPSPTHDRPDQ